MTDRILGIRPLGFPWETSDPFLFCAHHDDRYPAGNEEMGPAASLAGRQLGMDFTIRDGWRMYHGDIVPGFPRHPHRGFETITLARRGLIDHSDGLGAKARFGHGDVQWMTAGRGIEHAEMFPLVNRDAGNPTELFQIWLNLPAEDKMVEPYFTMLWADTIPVVEADGVKRVILAGADVAAPPNSWASRPDSKVEIWTMSLDPGARFVFSPEPGVNRSLYFFQGSSARIAGRKIAVSHGIRLNSEAEVELVNGPEAAEFLLLQGRPIGEPVAHRGPFVMNTPGELQQAYLDYRRGLFGGWPHARTDPVHARDAGRFALHADGREERP